MAVDAFVHLQRLRCVALKNTESRTEPYLWPVAVRVDDNTIAQPDPQNLVAVSAPVVGNARVIIKDSMRAGETAAIPSNVGVLRTRFEDGLTVHRLLLVVALLEEDETPIKAVRAGFQVFIAALREEVSTHLFELSAAEGEERDILIEGIQDRVQGRVKSAIKGALSGWEKAKVVAGILNLDDSMGAAFTSFGDPELVSAPIHLTFESMVKVFGIESHLKYEIEGQLELRRVVIDRCQAQVNAVNAAQQLVNGIEKQIQALKDAFGEASPTEKEVIRFELKELREEELPAAVEALEAARRALASCRSRVPPRVPDVDIVIAATATASECKPCGSASLDREGGASGG